MRILFYPENLDSGDSQRSAVEMAGAMVTAGYDVAILGGPGLLTERAEQLGVEVIPAGSARPGRRGILRSVIQLSKVVREREIEVIHAFEWESIVMAFGVGQLCRTHAAVTGTVLSREHHSVLPRTVPLLMGSRGASAGMRAAGFTRVGVLEPWVDPQVNNPSNFPDGDGYRESWGLDTRGLLVTVATSPAGGSATAGLATVLDVVEDIVAGGLPVQVLVIGGEPRQTLARNRARDLESRFGRTVVVAAGDLLDRRPALAAGDVIIGSDGSLLHGMAFGKPAIIEGVRGFFRAVNHATVEQFRWNGWFGSGTGSGLGKADLKAALEPLLNSARLREYRGAYSRQIAEKYGLDEAVLRQLHEYRDALDTRVGRFGGWIDLVRIGASLLWRSGPVRMNTKRRRNEAQLGPAPTNDLRDLNLT